jgi:endonuclease/exonuclease/phosphatase (EEP) superfamily protein YafD
LLTALGVWAILRAGDTWPPATALMFGPVWLLLLPPAVLIPAAAVVRRGALLTLIPALLVIAGPVMGFCVPWDRLGSPSTAGPQLRVMTCNMHHTAADPMDVMRLISEDQPDVVAIQEGDRVARSLKFPSPHWHIHNTPDLFLASRHPIRRAEVLSEPSDSPRGSVARYELETPGGTVTLFSLHLATPRWALLRVAGGDREGLAELAANSAHRRAQSASVAAQAERVGGPLVLVGDFNTPPHSVLFREVWGGYADAFGSAGWGWGYSFIARRTVVRIDHILVGGGGRATRCWVGPNLGSPHRPVLADVVWPAAIGRVAER